MIQQVKNQSLKGQGAILVNRENIALRARQYWKNHPIGNNHLYITVYVLTFQFDFTASEIGAVFNVTPRTARRWIKFASFYFNVNEGFRNECQSLYDYLLHNYKYIVYDNYIFFDGKTTN